MADVVHKWSEEKIPEYEQMMRVGIFSADEIKAIIKKTTALEYKLVRKMKAKDDYLSYVQYNMHLLSLIKKRRKRIQYYHKKDEIEFAIVSRIHRTFKQCTFRWPEDLKLWWSHIEFCKQWNKKTQLSKIWTTMLKFHGNTDINLWLMVAKWQYEDNHATDYARQIFLRGIRHFPDVPKLWLEYFKMELVNVMKTRQRLAMLKDKDQSEDVEEDLLKGEAAKIVYRTATEALGNKGTVKSMFLEAAVAFASFAGEVVNLIIEDLYENYPNEAGARAALARLHVSPAMVKVGENASQVVRAADLWAAEKRCFEDFETAVEDLNCAEIYHEYLMFLVSRSGRGTDSGDLILLNSAPTDIYSNERREKLASVFKRGHQARSFNSDTYLLYVGYLVDTKRQSEALALLEECSEFMECKKIQLKLLELASHDVSALDSESICKIITDLQRFVADMNKDEGLCFWSSWARYAEAVGSKDLLLQGLRVSKRHGSGAVVNFARPLLDLECGRDIVTGFGVFKNQLLPACCGRIEVLCEMLATLKSAEPPNLSLLRDCFESSESYYGKSSVEFWLKYVSFAIEYEIADVASLHWKAMKTLDSGLVAEFSEGYTILQAKRSQGV